MHQLLEKLLKKRNVEVKDLTPEEKVDFDKWQRILTEDVSVDSVSKFCRAQLDMIEMQMRDLNTSKEKLERLVVLFSVYSALNKLLNSPKAEREVLEKYLNSML